MKDKINIALAGCSARGMSMLRHLVKHEDVNIIAVCDIYEDRIDKAKAMIKDNGGDAKGYKVYNRMLDNNLDAVMICTSWETHITMAVSAMEKGIYPAIEVGGATSIEECWDLVRTSKKTGIQCMMLENCCYGREEMTILNLAKKGYFGEIVHCAGAYSHDLRDEIAYGKKIRHYRLSHYIHRNGELYPTHELGPILKLLNINNGNRMLTLCSMASKASGLKEYAEEKHRSKPFAPY